jgi:hypothetical protein
VSNQWTEAKPASPCLICDKTSWCQITGDRLTVMCRRQKDHPTHGAGVERKDKNGAPFWLYWLGGRPKDPAAAPTRSHSEGAKNPANVEERNLIYRRLWKELSGGKAVDDFLASRGVPKSSRLYKRYKVLPLKGRAKVARQLFADGLEPLMARAAGFVVKKGDHGDYWTLTGRPGIAIPVTDVSGRLRGFLVRPFDPGDGGKYLHLSSSKYGGAKAQPVIHVPKYDGETATARITEGVAKADIATELGGMLVIGLPGLYGPGLVKVLSRLGVKTVRLSLDADARDNPHVAEAIARHYRRLTKAGFTVELERWDPKEGKGIDDLLAGGRQPELVTGPAVVEAIAELVKAADAKAKSGKPATSQVGGGLVEITENELDVNNQVVATLPRDRSLYQRAGMLSRVVVTPAETDQSISRPEGARIVAVPPATLRERITGVVTLVKKNERGELKPAHPDCWIVSAVYARGYWPGVPRLEAVVEYPVLRSDGSLLTKPGYDPASGLYYHPNGDCDPVPDAPTRDDALLAWNALLEVVLDFPFEKDFHRSAWLAGLLTPLARFAFSGPAPLFLADANVRGAGKGLMLDAIALIATGKAFAVAGYTADDNEMRKRITAIAMNGDRLVQLDNIDGRFGGSSLDRALTATYWEDRILGENRTYRGPLWATWYGTSNNAEIGADTARRLCPIRLNSPDEHPEDRAKFTHKDLRGWVLANRPRLLAAALTILRAYVVAGRSGADSLPSWGSYEGWSALVRGVIVWLGLPDPIEARTELRSQSDVEAGAMGVLIDSWKLVSPEDKPMTAAQIIDKVHHPAWGTAEHLADVADALDALAPDRKPQTLGYRLRHYKKRVFAGRFFDTAGKAAGYQRWNVFDASGGDGGDGGHSFSHGGCEGRTHSGNGVGGGNGPAGECPPSPPSPPSEPDRGDAWEPPGPTDQSFEFGAGEAAS